MAVKHWSLTLGLGGSIEQYIGQRRRVKASDPYLRVELKPNVD